PGSVGDHLHDPAGLVAPHRLAGDAGAGGPVAVGEHGLHEVVRHPYRMVGVLVGDGVVGAALDVEAALVAGVDEGPGLALLDLLAADEVDDIRMVDVEDDHLGRPAGLAAALDDAGEGVEALHEGDRTRGRAAAGQRLARGAQLREVAARARAELEEHSLGLRQTEDGAHGVLDRVDEAGRALRLGPDADVEPHRRVEAGVLVEQDVRQLVAERLGVRLGGEVAAVAAPGRQGVRHPADELPDAALAVRRADMAAEVLRDHDVGRRLRPELRHLDALLLEDLLPLLVRDHGIAQLPLDGVEGILPGRGVVALEVETPCRSLLGDLHLRRSQAGLRGPRARRSAEHLVGVQGGLGLHFLPLLDEVRCRNRGKWRDRVARPPATDPFTAPYGRIRNEDCGTGRASRISGRDYPAYSSLDTIGSSRASAKPMKAASPTLRPLGAGVKRLNHKMLWVVTRLSPII